MRLTSPTRDSSSPASTSSPAAPRRIIVSSEAARLGRERLSRLTDAGFEVVERYDLVNGASEEALAGALANAWGFVAGGQTISRHLLAGAPDLCVIARTGAGYDRVDVDAATAAGVTVLVTHAENSDSVADLTLALMLSVMRQIVPLDRVTRAGQWRDGVSAASDLHGATVGLIGLGRIGQCVARRLSGFDCTVLASDPHADKTLCTERGIELLSLEEMLPRVDVLSLHVPLALGTRRLIGARELTLLPRHAVLVNTSRGGVVEQSALLDALVAGRIAGAGIDVFEREPLPAGHPLAKLSNVVLTPHVASYSRSAVSNVMDSVVQGLIDIADEKQPKGSVNGFPGSNGGTSH